MTHGAWSFVLSWSRVGINAALFLAATRVLTLAEIGMFATAFAPIRLLQAVQKAGVSDAVVLFGDKGRRQSALLTLSLAFGAVFATAFALIGAVVSPMLLALSPIPLLTAIGAVPEGILRHRLALRALALRTLVAQLSAAALALWLLSHGYGAWALVTFAVANAALTNVLSAILARWWPKAWPRRRDVTLIQAKTVQISTRALLNTSQMPLAQIAVGLTLGPVAAGAFQIATRMLELIDALTLSPLRYIALPELARADDVGRAIQNQTRRAATLAAWVWGGTLAATQPLLTVAVGPTHAPAATPVLQALAALGLLSALMMPVTQALTAKGLTSLPLKRAALSLTLSAVLLIPATQISATACALALACAGGVAHLWLLKSALPILHLSAKHLTPVLPPLLAGAAIIALLWTAPPLALIGQVALGTATYATLIALAQLPGWRLP